MKFVSTFAHGVLDYVVGIALLLAPNLFRFSEYGGAAVTVPRILGTLIILQALITRYELGAVKVLSLRAHLLNDYVAMAFLAVSPWLFGFALAPLNVWLPHLLVGIAGFLIAAVTVPVPHFEHQKQAATRI